MKKTVSLLALLLCLAWTSTDAFAACDWREKVQSEKIAFLTAEMDLTPAEAQAFWPLYNEAQKKKQEYFENAIAAYQELQQAVTAKEEGGRIETLTRKYVGLLGGSEEIDREYAEKYLKVIPAEKVARFFVAEEKFRRMQIHKLRRGEKKKD